MASMTEITCACGCNRKKSVRTADVKRGWGKYFSKSCKAKHQKNKSWTRSRRSVKSAHPYESYDDDLEYYYATTHPFSGEALGQD